MTRRYVPVAEVARPHGVLGELRLKVYNQGSDLLLRRPPVRLRLPEGIEREAAVLSAREVNKAILVKLTGVEDRNAAEALRGAQLTVARDLFPVLEDGEFYACDLEGARALLPSGEEVGRVSGLESYPTCDVLLIERSTTPDVPQGEKRKPARIEVPLVEAYVASVDIDRGVVQLVTIDGLA